jgi:hypothetical protein
MKQSNSLVGHGLTTAASEEFPTVGSGAETGKEVAKEEPLHRTSSGSCGSERQKHVKADRGWARSAHQKASEE